jgi:hypothetical protein
LDVSHRAATLNIEKLVTAGIVEEIARGRRGKLFIALGVVDTVEGRLVSMDADLAGQTHCCFLRCEHLA